MFLRNADIYLRVCTAKNQIIIVRFKVLTAASMTMVAFWVVAASISETSVNF
jgi:hypothetical protein